MAPLSPYFMNDFGRLRVLREFRERRSVTATAEALHLTPSAVSQQLARISRDVGFPVLEKSGRRVALTARAHVLLTHADAVFALVERARHDLDSWDDSIRGSMRIGAFSSAVTGLLPELLTLCKAEAPALQISVEEGEAPRIFDQLDAGHLDIALAVRFAGSPTRSDPRYHQVSLGEDPLDLAIPREDPRADDARVQLLDFEGDPWVAGDQAGCCGAITETACAAAGFTPDVRHRINDWQALGRLVTSGHAVALVPRLAQRDLPAGLVFRPIAGHAPRRHVFAAVTEGSQESPLIRTVLATLARVIDDKRRANSVS